MKRPRMTSLLRAAIPLAFVVLAVLGTVLHLGWGTLSSFGWYEIAAVCPLGALETMLAEKTVLPRAAAALAVFFVLTVIFGRFFCGWLCPVPGLSTLLHWVKNAGRRRPEQQVNDRSAGEPEDACVETPAQTSKAPAACGESCHSCAACTAAQRLKQESNRKIGNGGTGPLTVLVGALASSAVFGFPVFCLICPVGLTFALVIALSRLFQFNESGWAVLIFAAFLILELVVLRRWCHNFCPLGALISLMSRLNRTFVPRINPKACAHATHGVDCRICLQACPQGIDLRQGPLTASQIANCLKCGACAQACPSRAVSFPLSKSSPFAAVRPMPERAVLPVVPAHARVKNDDEVKGALSIEQAVEQSARCLRCGRCTAVCPQGNRISQWMTLLSRGDVQAAAQAMLREGALPEVCGRICPAERLCEKACSMQEASGAVMIADIERAVAQYALDHGFKPGIRRARVPAAVAVIGAGPAALACADYLVRRGVRVTIYDKHAQIGGLLSYGVPPFKLARSVVAKRRELLDALGATFVGGVTVGRDIAFEEIRARTDAVFVATGAGAAVSLTVPGRELNGVLPAMELLEPIGRRAMGESAQIPLLAGKRVVVLGGGDTAVDCLRCALREGALEAVAIARKPLERLRAAPGDLALALEEGAKILAGHTLERIVGQDGAVRAVVGKDAAGRSFELAADVVVVAYGFMPECMRGLAEAGVIFDERGRIRVNEDNATDAGGVYAGGDAVRGAALVTMAIADGRNAARAILRQCSLD